jgi:hypothetical protein
MSDIDTDPGFSTIRLGTPDCLVSGREVLRLGPEMSRLPDIAPWALGRPTGASRATSTVSRAVVEGGPRL